MLMHQHNLTFTKWNQTENIFVTTFYFVFIKSIVDAHRIICETLKML